MNKNILIISNDRLFIKRNKISSDYNDTINIIEGLAKNNNLSFYCRTTNYLKNYLSKTKKNNKFQKFKFFNLTKITNYKIFMISITPFNFLTLFFIKIFNKNIDGFVYLRSDGYKEYYHNYSWPGYFIYHLMFSYLKSTSNIISVSSNFTNLKQSKIIEPSELDRDWFKNKKIPNLKQPKLLYLGRFRKEKGVYSLLKLFKQIKLKSVLTLAGDIIKLNNLSKNIIVLGKINSKKKLIKIYDDHNIFILPSFTEGSPKVIKESLARLRPVIVFDEIRHVSRKYHGIYVCERSPDKLKKKIDYFLKNYKKIQIKMKKNILTNKKDFQKKLIKSINE